MPFSNATVESREAAQRQLARGGNRQVYSGGMVLHVWAAQSQESARSSNGNVYFHGRTAFSYGRHFPLGVIVGGAVFLNADSYSVTTSGHQHNAAYATNHLTQYRLPNLERIRYLLERAPLKDKTAKADALAYVAANPEADGAALEAFGALFGIKADQVARTVAKGRAAKLKEREADRKRETAYQVSEARRVANMSDADYQRWESRFVFYRTAAYADNVNVEAAEKQAREHATRLRRMIRALQGAKAAKRLIDRLKARVAAVKAYEAEIRPRAVKAWRAKTARELIAYRAGWRAVRDSGDQVAMVAFVDLHWLKGQSGSEYGIRFHRRIREHVAPFEAAVREQRRALEKAEREQREAEQRAKAAEKLEAWRNGESVRPPRSAPDGSAYVRRRGDQLETSQGAAVPWSHAVKAFRFIKLCRERGEAFRTNGRVIRVGHFRVDSIDAQGNMRAGCHYFAWCEIERLAKAENVFDVAASDDAVESSH